MNILRTALVIPAVVSGLWVVQTVNPTSFEKVKTTVVAPMPIAPKEAEVKLPEGTRRFEQAKAESASATKAAVTRAATQENQIIERRIRIERLLMALDQVAAVALQMQPEQAERLEPVIVDIAEQTLELVPDAQIKLASTDGELDRLEDMLGKLIGSMNRMVEPEMSL